MRSIVKAVVLALFLTSFALPALAERPVEDCPSSLGFDYFEVAYAGGNVLHVHFTQEPIGLRLYLDHGKNRMLTLDSETLQITKEVYWPTFFTIGGVIGTDICGGDREKCDVSALRNEIDLATKDRAPLENADAEARVKNGLTCAGKMLANFANRVYDTSRQQVIQVSPGAP